MKNGYYYIHALIVKIRIFIIQYLKKKLLLAVGATYLYQKNMCLNITSK